MVLNRRDLERAFSPHKHRRSGGQRRSLNKFNNGGRIGNQTTSSMRVVVRVRPQNANELENNARSVVQVIDENTLIFDGKEETQPFFFHGSKQNCRDLQKKPNKELDFKFDRVFGCDSSNVDVFEGSTKDIVRSLLDGYNCSVFAYGATGAGKTFTMLGRKTSPGITYLTIAELYRQMETLASEKEFDLGVSHLEVYNENVQDLIQPSGPLHLREDSSYGVRIPGLSVHSIRNADDLFALMAQGNRNRTQHPTDANAESSRSHSVFQLYVRMTNKLDRNMKIMKLSMIDLAGSERASATRCRGMRFTEGANINKSLLALGNCINSLADGLKHIPYRDSKLTRLLKDSLGGNCKTVMIANMSPSITSYEDTYNTLKYATRAKTIKQTIKKNIVSVQLNISHYAKVVEALTAENEKLKLKLKMYEAGNGSQEGASTSVAAPVVLPDYKNRLSAPYQELEATNREISKLLKEIKLLNWRNCVKQKIADRLPCLSINSTLLGKRLHRIRTSMKQLEGREMSCKQKLRETIIKRNEHFKKMNCVIKELNQDGSNADLKQHVTMLQLQLELEEKKMQLEHCQQLLSMQQNELESEDMIVKVICDTLKQYRFLLQGHNITTDAMISHYNELVQKLEGFKHISWKKDEETDDIHKFTFSIENWSGQSLCLEGAVKTQPSKKPLEDKVIPELMVDYAAKSGPSSSIVLTATSLENETSENESEVGDIDQCGDVCSDRMLEGTTNRVSVSINEIIAGSESTSAVTESDTNSSMTLETSNTAGLLLPVSQKNVPENTEVSEMERVKDKPAEYCGILNEMNLPVDRLQGVAAKCSVTPLKVGCDPVPSDYRIQGFQLNDTFVLPRSPPPCTQMKTPGRLVQRCDTQSKVHITVNESGSTRKRSAYAEVTSKLCNKENRAAAMRVRPSASCQRGQYKSSKDHTFTVPQVPQLQSSKPSMHRLTPISKYYKHPVTKEELGKMAYMKHRDQLNRAHPYSAD